MLDKKSFWIAPMIGLLALYGAALALALKGDTGHPLVRIMLITLAVHVLEIPLAFARLKGRAAQPLRVIVGTQIFGLLWWLPAQRSVFALR